MILQNIPKSNLDLGFIKIHLYGIIYAISFLLVYVLTEKNIEKKNVKLAASDNDSIGLLGLLFFSSIVTARLFYVFVYWGTDFLVAPLEIFKIWNGGMSYHGGLIGAVLALIIYTKTYKLSFRLIADAIVPALPVAFLLGRIGHFFNGEMWGRVTNGTWGVIFIQSAEIPVPRHPVQLYEALFEGIILFLILFALNKKDLPKGQLFSIFLIISGIFRFITEFFREPDVQVGYLFSFLTMGQVLSIPVIIAGIITFFMFNKKPVR